MQLKNHSFFYYIEPVRDNNRFLNFIEPDQDNVELTATVEIGEYTPTELALAVESAMNSVGDNIYEVSFLREENRFKIEANGDFNLLIETGENFGVSIFPTIGFTGNDTGVVDSAVSIGGANKFEPQFKLQDYVSSDFIKEAVSGVQSVSASGQVNVVSFGIARFLEFNIRYQNNYNQFDPQGSLKNSVDGLERLVSFMDFLIRKIPIEFVPDEMQPLVFEKIILEGTQDNRDGLGYRLREMLNLNIVGYYETGILRFRRI
jgi:hypothetical protein